MTPANRLAQLRDHAEHMARKGEANPNSLAPILVWPDLVLALLDVAEAARAQSELPTLYRSERLEAALFNLSRVEGQA